MTPLEHLAALRGDPQHLVAGELVDRRAVLREYLGLPEWHAQAACRGVGAWAFHPPRGGIPKLAKQLCAICPVRAQCLAEALTDPDLADGIWGGTTPRQRRTMRRPTEDES
jgi:WhiB family redox-sensing transcriptional regulator